MQYLFSLFLILCPIIHIAFRIKNNIDYKKSTYYQITKIPYGSLKNDTGHYGEFLTYNALKYLEGNGSKFLFNVYLPKEDGTTTEIDLLMISPRGIFVFESKNYSGWIFGSEHQRDWYQTLPAGKGASRKERFYNPIMQNNSHIRHLKAFLGEEMPMKSIIVFSDRCTLKSIQVLSNDVSVVNRCNAASAANGMYSRLPCDTLSSTKIEHIYNKLYPYTQVDAMTKSQHNINIYGNFKF